MRWFLPVIAFLVAGSLCACSVANADQLPRSSSREPATDATTTVLREFAQRAVATIDVLVQDETTDDPDLLAYVRQAAMVVSLDPALRTVGSNREAAAYVRALQRLWTAKSEQAVRAGVRAIQKQRAALERIASRN